MEEINSQCKPEVVYYWDPDINQYVVETTKIKPGIGYWVAVTNECTISKTGAIYELEPVSVSAGKTYLIGASSETKNVNDLLGTCDINKLEVKTYNAETQEYYSVNALDPGKGYWINSSIDCEFGFKPKPPFKISSFHNCAPIGNHKAQCNVLMGNSIEGALLEGKTQVYPVSGTTYSVTLDFVNPTSAIFTINGVSTGSLGIGDTFTLSDGTIFGVSEILYQDYAGGVHSATFYLGSNDQGPDNKYYVYVAGSGINQNMPAAGSTTIYGNEVMTTVVVLTLIEDTYQLGAWVFEGTNPDTVRPALAFWQGAPVEIYIS